MPDGKGEDIRLVERLQNGDIKAFDTLYAKYSSRIFSFCLKYIRSRTEAEEIVQSLFVKLWVTRKRLKKELSFKSYMYRIAYNEMCKCFRKQQHKMLYLKYILKENPNLSFEIEEDINNQLLLNKVDQIINDLPEKHRTILHKRRDEGKSSKEIGSEMHLTPGTVDNYFSEAIYIIRDKIKSQLSS